MVLQQRPRLIPFYTVLAMPFTYRALDAGLRAIDLRTLVDASRSLGAGWTTTMFRVLVPNLRSALLTSAFLTATVVLGEFTMASLMRQGDAADVHPAVLPTARSRAASPSAC